MGPVEPPDKFAPLQNAVGKMCVSTETGDSTINEATGLLSIRIRQLECAPGLARTSKLP